MEHQITSKVPNDMPWSNTHWSNQSGLALSHHDNRLGPNVVLEMPSNKKPRTKPNQTDDFVNSFTGTNWQRKGYAGTYWQNQNNNCAGFINMGGDIDMSGCSLWMCDYSM